MKILFLTLLNFNSLEERNIYTDLLREFVTNGHHVFAISPTERREGIKTHLVEEEKATILKLQIGNTQKTNIIEKGISTIQIEPQFKKAIGKYFSNVKFDLVLYSTPPITLVSAIEYVKKRDGAKTYLLLKDIFPQNAVDLGMLSTTGVKGILYKHFRKQEKRLYKISDRIGCMSKANVDYVIKHNPAVDPNIVEVCPNSIDVVDKSVDEKTRKAIRNKYGIPLDKKAFVYGGNLGKPQGIPFLVECLKECEDIDDAYFLIVGDGTEYHLLEEYVKSAHPKNVRLMRRLPKEDYDTMVGSCDVGMIFLDCRFSIPNFPSRILSYMSAQIPVLAVTDSISDVGKIIEEGNFGWRSSSGDIHGFYRKVQSILTGGVAGRGKAGFYYLKEYYCVENQYKTIMHALENTEG